MNYTLVFQIDKEKVKYNLVTNTGNFAFETKSFPTPLPPENFNSWDKKDIEMTQNILLAKICKIVEKTQSKIDKIAFAIDDYLSHDMQEKNNQFDKNQYNYFQLINYEENLKQFGIPIVVQDKLYCELLTELAMGSLEHVEGNAIFLEIDTVLQQYVILNSVIMPTEYLPKDAVGKLILDATKEKQHLSTYNTLASIRSLAQAYYTIKKIEYSSEMNNLSIAQIFVDEQEQVQKLVRIWHGNIIKICYNLIVLFDVSTITIKCIAINQQQANFIQESLQKMMNNKSIQVLCAKNNDDFGLLGASFLKVKN